MFIERIYWIEKREINWERVNCMRDLVNKIK